MGLCGAYMCGCRYEAGSVSTGASLNGFQANLHAQGSGERNDPITLMLDHDWASEVGLLANQALSAAAALQPWEQVDAGEGSGIKFGDSTDDTLFEATLSGSLRWIRLDGDFCQASFNLMADSTTPATRTGDPLRLDFSEHLPVAASDAAWSCGGFISRNTTFTKGMWCGVPGAAGEVVVQFRAEGANGSQFYGQSPAWPTSGQFNFVGSFFYETE